MSPFPLPPPAPRAAPNPGLLRSPYVVNEASFDLPDIGLVDATVHHIETTLPQTGTISIRAQRAPLLEGKTLADMVDEQIRKADIRLRAHRIVLRREIEIAGCPAIEIAAEWRGAETVNYTRQAHLEIDGTWLVLAGNAALDARAACDDLLDHALATFRLRG